MTAFTDKELKSKLAEAAKAGALNRVANLLEDDYSLEVITDEPLQMQIRVKKVPRDGNLGSVAPRYFLFRVQEPI